MEPGSGVRGVCEEIARNGVRTDLRTPFFSEREKGGTMDISIVATIAFTAIPTAVMIFLYLKMRKK